MQFKIDAQDLQTICNVITSCCDDQATRYVLGAVAFEFEQVLDTFKLVAIGTDGRRLATFKCDIIRAEGVEDGARVLLNGKELRRLTIGKSCRELVTVTITEATAEINWTPAPGKPPKSATIQRITHVEYQGEKHPARFPNWKQTIPDKNREFGSIKITASRWVEEWEEYQKNTSTLHCDITRKGLTPRVPFPNLPINSIDGEIRLAVDMDYLVSFLRCFPDGCEVRVGFHAGTMDTIERRATNTARGPLRIDWKELTYILMPTDPDHRDTPPLR
jgi:hypothetical protein